jgi:hypothetical protein
MTPEQRAGGVADARTDPIGFPDGARCLAARARGGSGGALAVTGSAAPRDRARSIVLPFAGRMTWAVRLAAFRPYQVRRCA